MKHLEVSIAPLYQGRDEGNYIIDLKRDGKVLSIFYGGNLDLYFSLENFSSSASFIIGKDNYEIYNLFDLLYQSIIDADIYGKMTEEEIEHIVWMSEANKEDYHDNLKKEINRRMKYKQDLKDGSCYQKLVNNGIITWKSDEYFDEITPYVMIKKQNDSYYLEFYKPSIPDKYKNEVDLALSDPRSITIRFRNSGSSYEPFNICFMKLYNALCKLDYEYHQIHIEEYLIDRQIEEGMSLSRILKNRDKSLFKNIF